MLKKKDEQNKTELKSSGVVPYVRKHLDKVIQAFKKLDMNVGIQ